MYGEASIGACGCAAASGSSRLAGLGLAGAVGVVWVVLVVVVAVPVAWLVKGTLEASQGGTTPAVAVIEVVGGLDTWIGKDDMVHVAHLLCGRSSGQLLGHLRAQRANLNAKGGSLEESNTTETIDRKGTAATVHTDVRASVPLYRDREYIGDATRRLAHMDLPAGEGRRLHPRLEGVQRFAVRPV